MTKSEYRELLERFTERTNYINHATIETLTKETPEEQERRVATLLRAENYGEMFNYYFGKDTPVPMADSACAWFHTDIYRRLYDEAYITLFNLIFRGGAKSTHANMGYPFALKESGRAKFFLIVGANEMRAKMLLQDMQVQLEANNRIVRDFGVQKALGSWADGQFETTDRCTFMALGLDQPFRGLRANGVRVEYASIDDCEDRKRSMNTTLIEEYCDKITGDIQGAFSLRSERTIVNNNYFTDKGIVATLLRRKGFDPKKLDTTHNFVKKSKFASIYLINLTDRYYQEIEADPAGEWSPSWSERYTREDCLRKIEQYRNDKATLSNEYYNTPVHVGKLFKPQMLKWVKPRRLADYNALVGFWDFSYTQQGDTKAMALIGCTDSDYTVLDVFCRHCDITDALDYHFTHSAKWMKSGAPLICYYDANVSQKAIYEPLLQAAARRYRSMAMPIETHNSTDKYSKVSATLGAAFGSGKLLFSQSLETNADWSEASHQLFSFEKGSKVHDDFPDALAEALRQAQYLFAIDEGGDEDDDLRRPVIVQQKRRGY